MSQAPGPTPTATGIPAVDGVLDLVAGLEQRPLEEHVEALGEAHGVLRAVLDDPPAADS